MNGKESIFIKILRWLGLIEEKPISKSEMCKQGQDICNHNCEDCIWTIMDEAESCRSNERKDEWKYSERY